MERSFPTIRKPGASYAGSAGHTLADHLASEHPHPQFLRKDEFTRTYDIQRHESDHAAHVMYYLRASELIFSRAEFEAAVGNASINETEVTTPSKRVAGLHKYIVTASALKDILDNFTGGGGMDNSKVVQSFVLGTNNESVASHTEYDVDASDVYVPGWDIFSAEVIKLINELNHILPKDSKVSGTVGTGTTANPLNQVYSLIGHKHSITDVLGLRNELDALARNSGTSGGEGSGGVITGDVCVDGLGNDLITTIDLTEEGNNKVSYTYNVCRDCLLLIEVKNAVIEALGVDSNPRDYIEVKVGSRVVGIISDKSIDWDNGYDTDEIRIPVRAGSVVTLVGDGEHEIFSETPAGSIIRFTEFKLTALARQVGMPNYDAKTDITSFVTRTELNESKNYKATSDGFVLFQTTDPNEACTMLGKINDVEVWWSGYRVDLFGSTHDPDVYYNHTMVPVRDGDTIDLRITNVARNAIFVPTNSPKVYFFPLETQGSTSQGPVEFAIVEHGFDDTTNNPFIDSTKIAANKLVFGSSAVKERTGRDVDISTAEITTRIDVFRPRYDANDQVIVDKSGFAVVDASYPMFRFDPLVWDAEGAGFSGEDKPFSVTKTGDGANTAVVCWPKLVGGTVDQHRLILRGFNALKTNVSIPQIDTSVIASAYSLTGSSFSTNCDYCPDTDADLASDRGLDGYYIRLTAVIDPKSTNIITTKSGVFIDGEINKDDNGNTCTTNVPVSDFESGVSYSNKTWYRYTYTAKTNCLLYASFVINATNAAEEIVVTIDGTEVDAYGDTGDGSQVADEDKQLTFPVKKGTQICFYYKSVPAARSSGINGILRGYNAVIRIIEFKMSTELTPAKFPSLAVRVFDVQTDDSDDLATSLDKHYTWTEEQLSSVFGPKFSLDNANIRFSAVFYKGTSVADYDSTNNKIEDTEIEVTDNGIGHVHPIIAVVGKEGVGNVLDVQVPQLPYFVSAVTCSGGDVVKRNSREGIGEDIADASGIRMRLLMHVSDRRGKLPEGDTLPNGISPNSRMVRQGDMNLNATASGASYTYSNEITITESGWCIIHANYDTDGNILNGTTTYSVQIQALINNEWADVAMQDNKSLSSSINTDSGWDFAFPVEAGLKLRARTNFNNDGTGPTDYKSGTYPYTRRQQAICWVIPTAKYMAPEYNLPGSAGVIDGSIWKKADGTDEITPFNGANVTKIEYNVHNDCLLTIQITSGAVTGFNGIYVYVNNSVVGRLVSVTDSTNPDCISMRIPVARGSVVKLENSAGGNLLTTGSGYGSGEITFTEFKLRATNVVAAMPDWDKSKDVDINNGDIVPADGWIVVVCSAQTASTGTVEILINGVSVLKLARSSNSWQDVNGGTFPVSKGDIITWTGDTTVITPGVTFYPIKMHKVRTTSASAIEVIAMSSKTEMTSNRRWWKVFNNGWCEQGGYTNASTVQFGIPFVSDSEYTFIRTDGGSAVSGYSSRTTSGAVVSLTGGAIANWRAEGWISDASLIAIEQGKVWDPTADSGAGAWVNPS